MLIFILLECTFDILHLIKKKKNYNFGKLGPKNIKMSEFGKIWPFFLN